VGDSLQLSARALDASGKPIPQANIFFKKEGLAAAEVDSTGMVRAGGVGDVIVIVTALVLGSKPALQQVIVKVLPSPARRIEIGSHPGRLVPGQRVRLAARVLSAKPSDAGCSPTWAQPSTDGRRVFVACNKSSEIAEIDVGRWALTRRWPAGEGVYNLAVTHNGKLLLATNKRGQSVSVFDATTGRELKRLATRRKVVHGVAVSPDDRYAFVSVEGVGSEPGTVEVIDLGALTTVVAVDVGSMAAGVDVWKVQ
jgi:DNA-binding beta-propeller fold protein YncE